MRNGAVEYQEIQSTVTDKYGMVTLIIGQGETTAQSSGYFDEISWDGSPKLLIVALAYEGGAFSELSSQELLFVPYAYHRNITATGTLDVDQETTLNSNLSVMNESLTYLSGDLITEGDAQFNGHSTFNSIYVENSSVLNGSLDVSGMATFNNSLSVLNESPVYLSGSLTTDGSTILNNSLDVLNMSPSYLSGSLDLDGIATFNNSFSVQNASPVYFSGSLNVDGVTTFNAHSNFSSITVNGQSDFNAPLFVNMNAPVSLSGDLTVGGTSILEGALTTNGINTFNSFSFFNGQVDIDAPLNVMAPYKSTLNGELEVNDQSVLNGNITVNGVSELNGNSTVNGTADINGQVTIQANNLSGGQSNDDAYPLRVQGGDQGIHIRVNGTGTTSKNYMTFRDGQGIKGRIEGQTLSQLQSSFRFLWDFAMGGLELAFIAAEGVATSAQLDWGESGVMAANYVVIGAKWVELTAYQEK